MTQGNGNDVSEQVETSDVAVVGMAGRFPGAPDLGAFWRNLRDGVESITSLTDEQLRRAGESPAALRDPAYVRACPVLADIDQFDAGFFGWTPRDAAITDPQHRLFLEVAWEAFENAGYHVEAHEGPVAVFASCGMNSYMMYHLVTNSEVMETVGEWLVRHTGNDMNFLATRVSYELGLRGPSMTVQTACSSSLVAIHLACQSLLNGECDMALAGGSTILLPHGRGYLFKEGEILSPDGHCRPFDARSAGTVFGSGAGCVVLKRLADALAAGDTIHAVIKGSAVNNDGSTKVGYLAPSVDGQTRAVAEALALTGIDPETITYVEAHGTATAIGDPIEVTALTQAYRTLTDAKQFCAIGSLKSNIGHLGEAAGVAGFIKTTLALQNRQIPPSLHHEKPNPQIDFAESPFFVAARLEDWKTRGAAPRRAGITALGAGGTNVHAILEEAPAPEPPGKSRDHQLLLLSAKTPTALDAATNRLAEHLAQTPDLDLADVAFTLAAGRKAFPHRRAIVCRKGDVPGAAAALAARDPGRVLTQLAPSRAPSVVFMFPGGGAQYAGMGAELYETEPVYRETIDSCIDVVRRGLGFDLRTLMFPEPGEIEAATRRLESPSLALPALFATEYALAKLLLSWGVEPAAMIGHSMGEYVAACLAGVLTFQNGMALVALRGRLFETLPPGGMLSIPLPEAEARAFMSPDLSFAAINGPSLCVASGPVDAIRRLEEKLTAADINTTRIHINVAAHSAMLEPILGDLERFCRTLVLRPPQRPYISNLTGDWITREQATDPMYWVKHLRSTVRFADGLGNLLRDPDRVVVELGPGRTLTSLAQQQPRKARAAISTVRHPQTEGSDVAFLFTALARLWLCGGSPDWARFYEGETRRRVPLPTYPFERKRHWIDAPTEAARTSRGPAEAPGDGPRSRARDAALHKTPDIADWFRLPSWKRTLPPAPLATTPALSGKGWLLFTDARGLGDALAARLPGAVTVTPGAHFEKLEGAAYRVSPSSRADLTSLFDALQAAGDKPSRIVHLWAVTPPAGAASPDTQALCFDSLFFLAQALSAEEDPVDLTVVSTGLQSVTGDEPLDPEKALLLGPCKVIPRELPNVRARSIDVPLPPSGSQKEARLADRLLAELLSPPQDTPAHAPVTTHSIIAYRGADRWVQTFEPVKLPPASTRDWVRKDGVYLVTGGLGGLGLELAEHLAKITPASPGGASSAKLVLVGRAPLPPREEWQSTLARRGPSDPTARKLRRLQAILALGAEVVTESADVTSPEQMAGVVARTRARFGAIHGVVHAAGTLEDALIVMKTPEAARSVLAPKVQGALVLDAALAGEPLDFFVLFSSVSSILGLQGQVDYTAGNAFLDAFARARSLREPSRTLAINWGAWQDVGMVVAIHAQAAQHPSPAPTAPARETAHPFLERHAASPGESVFFTRWSRDRQWLLGEHVIKGAEALIPGTGYLEIARAALEESAGPALPSAATGAPRPRAVEIRDLLFLAPFAVKQGETREMRLTLHRATSEMVLTSTPVDTPPGEQPVRVTHVTAQVTHVDMPPPRRVDLEEIRRRCADREEVLNGFMDQQFMDFGPRWKNLRSIRYGKTEALVTLELSAELGSDLDTFPLHPALLDMATGSAQGLIPGFDRTRDFFVPFSYGRVVARGPLTGKLVSHVELADGATRGMAVFHVTLFDEAGLEIVKIQDFVMKRIEDRAVMTGAGAGAANAASPARAAPEHASSSALALFREGILPAEGLDAFDRILASGVSAGIVASSIDLGDWLAQTDALARPAAPAATAEGAKSAEPRAARPDLSTPYVAPRDDLERDIAGIWQTMLGLGEVGVHDDFFEIGGYSLLLTQTVTRVRKMAHVDISLRSLFAKPTIAEIAAEIRRARAGAEAGPAPGAPPAMKAVSRDAYRVKRSAVQEAPQVKKPNTA